MNTSTRTRTLIEKKNYAWVEAYSIFINSVRTLTNQSVVYNRTVLIFNFDSRGKALFFASLCHRQLIYYERKFKNEQSTISLFETVQKAINDVTMVMSNVNHCVRREWHR